MQVQVKLIRYRVQVQWMSLWVLHLMKVRFLIFHLHLVVLVMARIKGNLQGPLLQFGHTLKELACEQSANIVVKIMQVIQKKMELPI
ncbi:zinc finger BED domain-containing protein RICESLEEPER 2-like [Iris pallida]|uniref:Zinc finger BED domain-containing protein RICESLEEPER 2-like n=1 Tax=Iris pallida TaxID=29817 RepID=A0AAX6H108_IRIPA|nr:zinc finger BED domain-containing protein RICESLEEPER 2-like [Iris pallida]